MFIDELVKRIKEKNNPTVVGLDPRLEFIPSFIRQKSIDEFGKGLEGAAGAVVEFNKRLIDAVYDIVPAVKTQLAYYEMLGLEGIKAFQETVAYAGSKNLMIIADGKRNDIGTTAQAYSTAYLGKTQTENGVIPAFDVDALTVNPYLGIDGIKPFIDDCEKYGKGIFILVKTSNKSSGQLQDIITENGKSIYEIVAELVDLWGASTVGASGYSSVGAVVGATYPNQAKRLRSIMKKAYILVPGYGAQGGLAMDAAHCFNSDGLGAIVNASRSIMCAWQSDKWSQKYGEKDFAAAAREEAIRMRDDLNKAIESKKQYSLKEGDLI